MDPIILFFFDGPQVIAVQDIDGAFWCGNAVTKVEGVDDPWPFVIFRVTPGNLKRFLDDEIDLRALQTGGDEIRWYSFGEQKFMDVVPISPDYLPDSGLMARALTEDDAALRNLLDLAIHGEPAT